MYKAEIALDEKVILRGAFNHQLKHATTLFIAANLGAYNGVVPLLLLVQGDRNSLPDQFICVTVTADWARIMGLPVL